MYTVTVIACIYDPWEWISTCYILFPFWQFSSSFLLVFSFKARFYLIVSQRKEKTSLKISHLFASAGMAAHSSARKAIKSLSSEPKVKEKGGKQNATPHKLCQLPTSNFLALAKKLFRSQGKVGLFLSKRRPAGSFLKSRLSNLQFIFFCFKEKSLIRDFKTRHLIKLKILTKVANTGLYKTVAFPISSHVASDIVAK